MDKLDLVRRAAAEQPAAAAATVAIAV
jgi:hypothetical protein